MAAVSELVTPCDRLSGRELPAVASALALSTARLAYWGILACTVGALAAHLIAACAPVAVSDAPQVTKVLAAEPAPRCFDADEIGIRWRRTAWTQSVCPVQAALDKGSCLVKLGPAGYC